MSFAEHCPAWQKHPPPQSMVFGMHMCVHMIPPHDGAWLRGTHLSAWQQTAGTQSESFVHAAALGAALAVAVGDEAGAPPDVSVDDLGHLATAMAATRRTPLRMSRNVPEATDAP